jgi:hypothetical protein
MSWTFPSAILAAGLCALAVPPVLQSSPRADDGPPVPYEDVGACPFEGCTYREWVAQDVVAVRSARQAGAPVIYRLAKGEHVTALTGVVVTLKAGRVQFREAVSLDTNLGPLHVEPGETLFLLTYQGEGSFKAWFRGKLYASLDGTTFYNGACDGRPFLCKGKIVEQTQSVWWAQLRDARGQVGWTDEAAKFGGKDAYGDSLGSKFFF